MLFLFLPFLLLGFATLVSVVDLAIYLFRGSNTFWPPARIAAEISALVIGPFLFFTMLNEETQDCCHDTPYFANEHTPSIIVLVLLSLGCYLLARRRPAIGSPMGELLVNCGLLLGIGLNVILFFHITDGFWWLGNFPAMIFFMLALLRRHQLAIHSMGEYQFSDSPLSIFCQRLLRQPAYQKFPILLLLCLPLLVVVWLGLMLMGQQPDALVRVFTETYNHGFSTLQCDYSKCPDQHFLCTIAAEGHPELVAPVRFGQRQGYRITVNRQLLIANAFEEILAERAPRLHRFIRRHYNRLGRASRRGFEKLRYRGLADAVYLLMKPLEWLFLLVIYAVEAKPENCIARQYLTPEHQQALRALA
jgi:hypothetical protein